MGRTCRAGSSIACAATHSTAPQHTGSSSWRQESAGAAAPVELLHDGARLPATAVALHAGAHCEAQRGGGDVFLLDVHGAWCRERAVSPQSSGELALSSRALQEAEASSAEAACHPHALRCSTPCSERGRSAWVPVSAVVAGKWRSPLPGPSWLRQRAGRARVGPEACRRASQALEDARMQGWRAWERASQR